MLHSCQLLSFRVELVIVFLMIVFFFIVIFLTTSDLHGGRCLAKHPQLGLLVFEQKPIEYLAVWIVRQRTTRLLDRSVDGLEAGLDGRDGLRIQPVSPLVENGPEARDGLLIFGGCSLHDREDGS